MKLISKFLKLITLLGLTLCFASSNIVVAQENRQIGSRINGITAYKKIKNEGKWLSLKGEAVIDAPIGVILYFFKDVKRSVRFTPGIHEKRILEELSDKDRIEYTRAELPWPFKDRYTIYHAREAYNKGNEVLLTMDSVKDYPYTEKDKVLGAVKDSHFLLKSLETDATKTLVTVEVHFDPGGWLPHWLIKLHARNWTCKFLKKLGRHVQEYLIQQKSL